MLLELSEDLVKDVRRVQLLTGYDKGNLDTDERAIDWALRWYTLAAAQKLLNKRKELQARITVREVMSKDDKAPKEAGKQLLEYREQLRDIQSKIKEMAQISGRNLGKERQQQQ